MSWRYKGGFIQEFFDPLTEYLPPVFGTLWSWGYNANGELGQNNLTYRSSPVQVGSQNFWSSVVAGETNGAATRSDGALFVWGSNGYGQLGQNNIVDRSSPVQVGALTNWSKVSFGYYSIASIKTDGSLWAWGWNVYGQLGQNDIVYRSSPVQVGALTDWADVSMKEAFFALATKTDGTLWSFGRNNTGQLGLNNTVNKSSPVQIGSETNWSKICVGADQCLAIKTNGTLWSWGNNLNGELGQNDTIIRSSPVQVGALTTWSSISASNLYSAAIRTDGTLWTWGSNDSGRLGQNISYLSRRSSPVQVGSLTTWSKISIGRGTATAIKTDGTLWTWGRGLAGQIGDNNVVNRSSPVQVGTSTQWSSSAASGVNDAFVVAVKLA